MAAASDFPAVDIREVAGILAAVVTPAAVDIRAVAVIQVADTQAVADIQVVDDIQMVAVNIPTTILAAAECLPRTSPFVGRALRPSSKHSFVSAASLTTKPRPSPKRARKTTSLPSSDSAPPAGEAGAAAPILIRTIRIAIATPRAATMNCAPVISIRRA